MAEILALPNMLATPYGALLESTELNFRNLFLHQIRIPEEGEVANGVPANQGKIVPNNATVGMGETAVNNWALYDGEGRRAKRVASVKGMHMKAEQGDHWYCSLVIVFDGEKFTGSTLQVMGIDVSGTETSEWGIVGGTGEFAMARGVIKREESRVAPIGQPGKVQKLTIHAFCVPRSFPDPTIDYEGSWPREGDNNLDYDEGVAGSQPRRLLSVKIHCGFVVDALEYTYLDQTGQERTIGSVAGAGGHFEEIKLGTSDFIKGVKVTSDRVNGQEVVTSLTLFGNNDKTYGPFGRGGGTEYYSKDDPSKPPRRITGFFGRKTKYLDFIGIYFA